MWDYNEALIVATLIRLGDTFHEAGRTFPDPDDPWSLVHLARIQFDCQRRGAPWEVSVRRHLQALRTATPPDGFGLPPKDFGRLDGEDTHGLHIDGYTFVVNGGGPFLMVGVSLFTLYKRFLELPLAQFHVLLDEPLELGFNTAVVFSNYGGPGWEEELRIDHPGFYERMPDFFDQMAMRKMRTDWVVFTGASLMGLNQQQPHYVRTCAIVKDRPLVFLRLMNEVNGIDWRQFGKPDGVLYSVGTFGGGQPPEVPNIGDMDDFEVRRDWPKTEYDAGGGTYELEDGFEGYPGTHKLTRHIEPLKFGEPDPWGRGETDPAHARQWAQQAVGPAGGIVFHSHDGIYCCNHSGNRTGKFRPITRACAVEFARAARVGFVR